MLLCAYAIAFQTRRRVPMLGTVLSRIFSVGAIIALLHDSTAAREQFDPDRLLQLGAQRVKNNTRALRRLTCGEQTSREFYLPSKDSIQALTKNSAINSDTGLPLPALVRASLQVKNCSSVTVYVSNCRSLMARTCFRGRTVASSIQPPLDGLVTFGATLSGVLGAFAPECTHERHRSRHLPL